MCKFHVNYCVVDYSELFKQLGTLRGTCEQKTLVLDRVIYEAYRFKRVPLTDQLLKYKQTLNHQSPSHEQNGLAPADNDTTGAEDKQTNTKPAHKSILNSAALKPGAKPDTKHNAAKTALPTLSKDKSKTDKS